MTDTIDTHLADLRLVCAAIEREVANLRAVFKSQRDAAQQAEARALKQAEDSRAGWADENAAKCRAQSNCAIARETLRIFTAEVARWSPEHTRLATAAALLLDAIDHHWVGDLPTALESIAVAINKHGVPWSESLKYEIFDALAAKR